MRNMWLLFRVQLSGLLGLNKIRHIKDPRERRKKTVGRVAVWLCMLCLIPTDVMYSYFMATGMQAVGALSAFPAVMLALTGMMCLLSSVATAHGTLYAFKDYEQVVSLPVGNRAIAMSRLLLVYVSNLLFSLILLPAGGVYAYLAHPGWPFWPLFLITWPFVPVAPMLVGCLLGAAVSWVGSRLRGGKYLTTVLAMGVSLAIIWFSSNSQDLEARLGSFALTLSSLAQRIYPLTGLYMRSVADFSIPATLAFIGLSALLFLLMAEAFGACFRKLNTALNTHRARGHYRMRTLRAASPLRALYRRELKRYLSSPIWVTNTAFSLVMALVGVGVLAFKMGDLLDMLSDQLGPVQENVTGLVPFAALIVSVFSGMCCTTAASISMEGKHLWIAKTLPVPGFQVMLSKLMVNWTLTVPASLILSGALSLMLRPTAAGCALLFLLPLSLALCFALLGLLVNLRLHSFDWTSEAMVIKQSASAGICTFAGMLLPIGLGVLMGFCFAQATQIAWILTAVFFALAALGLALIRRRADRWLLSL